MYLFLIIWCFGLVPIIHSARLYLMVPTVCWNEEAEGRDRMSPTDVAHLSQNILLPLMLDDARMAAVRSCPSSQVLAMQGDGDTSKNLKLMKAHGPLTNFDIFTMGKG